MAIVGVAAVPTQQCLQEKNLHDSDSSSTISVLTDSDRAVLTELGQTKKAVFILVRRGHEFFYDLREVKRKRTQEFGLVAFVPEASKKNMKPEVERCFDWVVYYDDSDNFYKGALTLDDIRVPKLYSFADELVNIVPTDKIRLIHTEETSMSEVCRVREQFGLKGAYMDDVKHMRQKELMYDRAEKSGIPIAKTVYIDFLRENDCNKILNRILQSISSSTFFAKPTMMVAGYGGVKLKSLVELKNWIDQRLNDDQKTGYVVQEFLDGREFNAICVLLQNGACKPIAVKYLLGVSTHEGIHSGKPLVCTCDRFEEANSTSFTNLNLFIERVIKAYKPEQPQIFTIQGFQVDSKGDNYLLNELCYRPAGDVVDTILYPACGIDQYSALILSHMDPNYRPQPPKNWHPKVVTRVWYAQKTGILKSHKKVPQRPEVMGNVTAYWFVKPGQKMKDAAESEDVIVGLHLESTTKADRDCDVAWICKNWAPDVKAM
ncbi:hypothetical protein L596_030805 [Steinernema carpocapsae]|uniref:ATP-grasp domain-containing protein n=1 Tax=Steinernema carpocapsae TaxID=34508 RepID=A0A4U5LNT5_STECR|nr:hypothetical protein L596_030805 [Steinernema carpocapsae]